MSDTDMQASSESFSQVHRLIIGDALTVLRSLPSESVDLCVTSSPYYGLRDYGANCSTVWGGSETCEHQWESTDGIRKSWGSTSILEDQKQGTIRGSLSNVSALTSKSNFCSKCGAWKGQLGLEPTFQLFIDHLLLIFKEVKRVLKSTGSLYFNIGDSYSGSPIGSFNGGGSQFEGRDMSGIATSGGIDKTKSGVPTKCLLGIPERLMIRLIDEQGWVCRNKNIWYKRNHMPSSVQDRYANSYEPVLFFSKQSEKDLLWRNALTKEWVNVKPVQKYIENGELHDSYRWWCHRCKATGTDFKTRRKHKQETGHRTEGRKPLWRGFDCYFDLDAIRVPHTVCGVTDKRPMGVLRQKLYKGSRYNKSSDPHLAQYQGKFEGAGESAEAFGSPRARTQRNQDADDEEEYGGKNQVADPHSNHRRANLSKKRKQDNVPGPNAATYEGFNERWKLQQGDQSTCRGINEKGHSGYYDKDGNLIVNPDGKNPGDVLDVSPEVRPKSKLGVPSSWGTGEDHPTNNSRFFAEGGKNPGDFMDVTTQPFKESHFATYPEALITPFIKASCPKNGVVLDPFGGSGTTAKVARDLGRNSICIEINPDYESLWHNRLKTKSSLDIKYVVEKLEGKKQN